MELGMTVCQQISHVERYIGADEESLTVNDLVIPGNKLIPLMRPDFFSLLIDVLVRLRANVVVTPFDREIERLKRYRTARRTHSIFILGVDFIHQPFQEAQTRRESKKTSYEYISVSAYQLVLHKYSCEISASPHRKSSTKAFI